MQFTGVLNGIDTNFWCPSRDPLIPAPFNSAAPAGKALCKRFVQRGLGLDVDAAKPLMVCITRLVPQKGIHLIRAALWHTIVSGGQFVLLGSGHADGDFRALAEGELKDNPSARCATAGIGPTCVYGSDCAVDVPPVYCMHRYLRLCPWGRPPWCMLTLERCTEPMPSLSG